MSRVLDQKENREGFPKAGELIEIQPVRELTLQDRRVFNILIQDAGPEIAYDVWHEVPISKLRGPRHKGGERVSDSLNRLMTTLVKIPVKDPNGLDAILTTVLIAENLQTIEENDSRAILRYKLTGTMRKIIENSRYWGRLKAFVVFAFSSKYGLALYEALCLRINLQASTQVLSVEQFRRLLDVPDAKLAGFPQLNQSAIQPALLEVNGLSDFMVEVEPVREGGHWRGKLTGFRVSWRRKTKQEWDVTFEELMQPKIGRKARLSGQVEQLEFYQAYEG